MGQQASLIAFDGGPTPTSRTLVPNGITILEDGTRQAEWKTVNDSAPEYAQIRCLARKRKLGKNMNRVSIRVEVPVMEVANGGTIDGFTAPPKVAYTDTLEVVGYFHDRSTANGKRLVRQLALNLLNGVTTSVTPVTGTMSADLMDQLIIAT